MMKPSLQARLALGSMAVALFTTGCMTNAVTFSTATRFGIEIATTDQSPGAKVGYQRFEGTTMPFRHEEDGTMLAEAYPLVAGFGYSTGGLIPVISTQPMGTRIRQVFATGEAAKETTAPAVVLSALNAEAARVGIAPKEPRELAGQILATLRSVPAERQADAFEILSEELGTTVTNMEQARDAVQDAGSGIGDAGAPALTRARTRINVLLVGER